MMAEVESLPVAMGASARAAASDQDMAMVRQVQGGDVRAFDKLVDRYKGRLYAVIYNLTGNREDANDLTQEAFIKAFRSIQRFHGKSSFFTWIYRIGVNTTLSFLKRHRGRRYFSFDHISEETGAAEIVEELASNATSDRPTVLRELQERLNEALQKLSPKHRTTVILFEIEGLSHQQIADIMSTTEGTVRSRLHYAKQLLQNDLKDLLE